MKRKNNKRIYFFGLTFIPVFFTTLFIFIFWYTQIHEPVENDSLPESHSKDVIVEKVDIYPYQIADPFFCNEDTIQSYLNSIPMNGNTNPIICKKYALSNSNIFYFIDNSSLAFTQKLLLLKNNQLEEILVINPEYPGNKIKNLISDGDSIFFTYSGWNNPKKLVKVSLRK